MALIMNESQIDELAKAIANTRMNGMNLNSIDEFINTYLDVYDAAKMIITKREKEKRNAMDNLSLDDVMTNESTLTQGNDEISSNRHRMSL